MAKQAQGLSEWQTGTPTQDFRYRIPGKKQHYYIYYIEKYILTKQKIKAKTNSNNGCPRPQPPKRTNKHRPNLAVRCGTISPRLASSRRCGVKPSSLCPAFCAPATHAESCPGLGSRVWEAKTTDEGQKRQVEVAGLVQAPACPSHQRHQWHVAVPGETKCERLEDIAWQGEAGLDW